MRNLDDRARLSGGLRPKGADVDKPAGYTKKRLRRIWRRILKRSVLREGDGAL